MSMTESEALEWFKGFYNADCEREDFEDAICADCMFPCIHGVPVLRAISALEKQIPKKPNPNKKPRKGYYVEWYCPTCEKYIASGYYYPPLRMASNHNCCVNCGQKLDWSEGKE